MPVFSSEHTKPCFLFNYRIITAYDTHRAISEEIARRTDYWLRFSTTGRVSKRVATSNSVRTRFHKLRRRPYFKYVLERPRVNATLRKVGPLPRQLHKATEIHRSTLLNINRRDSHSLRDLHKQILPYPRYFSSWRIINLPVFDSSRGLIWFVYL